MKLQFEAMAEILPLRSLFFFCGGDSGSGVTSGCSSRSDALLGRHLVDKTLNTILVKKKIYIYATRCTNLHLKKAAFNISS